MTSPTTRTLLALEAIQASPGITAGRLGERLGVTERAARRAVSTLRDAGVPVESTTGPLGGYRLGRGMRLPPLMFSAVEATGLAMAVLEGHRGATDPDDVVGGALAKIVRVLPGRVADQVRAVSAPASPADRRPAVDPEVAERLVAACSAGRRLRLSYRRGRSPREMEVEPWAVVLRHGYWYLLCWSSTADARRVLRVDRVESVVPTVHPCEPPEALDALAVLEEHLSQGWPHEVDVLVEAPIAHVRCWLPRSLGRLEEVDEHRTRLTGTTEDTAWYARRIAAVEAPLHVVGGPELRAAMADLARSLDAAATPG